MTESTFRHSTRFAARAAVILAGMYLAFAVGAPWMLNDAPPTPQDFVASKVCCAKAVSAK